MALELSNKQDEDVLKSYIPASYHVLLVLQVQVVVCGVQLPSLLSSIGRLNWNDPHRIVRRQGLLQEYHLNFHLKTSLIYQEQALLPLCQEWCLYSPCSFIHSLQYCIYLDKLIICPGRWLYYYILSSQYVQANNSLLSKFLMDYFNYSFYFILYLAYYYESIFFKIIL